VQTADSTQLQIHDHLGRPAVPLLAKENPTEYVSAG
ncbi:uncharacterized protein METZ01_LOCUS317209, partial [marine metagenome]